MHPPKRPRMLSPGGILVYQRDPIANTTENTVLTCYLIVTFFTYFIDNNYNNFSVMVIGLTERLQSCKTSTLSYGTLPI